jgi:pectate lyase
MRLAIIYALLLTTPLALVAAEKTPAFPGAEGFGAFSVGGRGGRVFFVTNLDDYAVGSRQAVPGSLRAACEAKGPRIVVFRVSGTIELSAPITIREPFITIAGQTAPGEGICLKNYGLSVNAQDVVIRHLRVRPGDEPGPSFRAKGRGFAPDGISVGTPSQNVIIDHCSVSWAIDECLSVSGAGITDVTVQWCIISEALNHSFHDKGPHGYGSLLRTNGNLSFHHNLYAHHVSRSPRPGTYGEGSVLLDFRNNVIHDSRGYSAADPVRMNYVGNYIKRPRSQIFQVGGKTTQIFAAGNFLESGGARNDDQWELITGESEQNKMPEPFAVASVTTDDGHRAYEAVIASAGATLPRRDAVDERIIRQLQSGAGSLINSQKEVGGWPDLRTAAAPTDTDNDGLPDAWETKHGLNSHSATDASADLDADGYTNIEEFLNGTDPSARDRA